ncbi:DUF4214 domain-containing protein [Orrella daihaiensis]|uniref:DUF4214 domain-containing protein n=1 Tax=Orrella daihaiensis TaxID=2782176 RepID=A0ABY4AP97_9BURK|nr:cadherin-like domain-containing protein [Orrella daihaiensis]UOD51446.1 DUF4214 domain-containing protein [Orrella daihaiensis]
MANTAPTWNVPTYSIGSILEDATSPTGFSISSLSNSVSDSEGDQFSGIVITSNTATQGAWQYSTDGANWYDVGAAVYTWQGLLLDKNSSLRFVPVSNYNGTPDALQIHAVTDSTPMAWTSGPSRQFFNAMSDGPTSNVSGSPLLLSVTVTAVNDDPSMTGVPFSITVTEDTGSPVDLSSITLSDVDSGSGNITVNLNVGAGTLSASSGFGVTVGGSGTGSLFLFGTASNIDTYLNTASNIYYQGPPNGSGLGYTTLVLSANDGGNSGAGGGGSVILGTVNVNITAVNDAPVFSGLNGAPSFTEGGVPVVLDSTVTVSDVELAALNAANGDYSGASLTIGRYGGANADDYFAFNTSGASFTVSGTNLQAGGQTFATFTEIGGTLTVSFTSSSTTATTALVNDVLSRIQYGNSSNDPPTSVRLDWTFADGSAGTDIGSTTVAITAVNDEPTLSTTGANPTFTEGGSAQALFTDASVSTVESGQTLQGLTLTVTNVADSTESLEIDGTAVALTDGNSGTTATNDVSFAVSVTGGTATVALTGASLSAAAMQTLIDGITYSNSSQAPSTNSNRVVTITGLQDSGGTANGGTNSAALALTSTVTVTAVNDAPTVAVNSGLTVLQGGSGTIVDTLLDASDPDDAGTGLIYTVTTSTSNGDLFIDTNGNSLVDVGELLGVSSTFTQADIDNGLIKYLHGGGLTTTDSFVFRLADGGENSAAAVTGQTFNIAVTAVNGAPAFAGLNGAPSFTEGGSAVVLDSSVTVSDIELDALNAASGNYNGASLTIARNGGANADDDFGFDTSTASFSVTGSDLQVAGLTFASFSNNAGTLRVDFTSLEATATAALVDNVLSHITYRNLSNDPSSSVQLDWTFADGSAGTDIGSTTVAITAVNDAPTLTATGADPTFTEDGSAQTLFSNAAISTVESGQTLKALTLTVTNVADSTESLQIDGSAVALTDGNSGATEDNSVSYAVSVTGETATVALTGATLSEAAMQTLINGITYSNSSQSPSTASSRVVTITGLQDSGGMSNSGSDTATLSLASVVTVAGTNDLPTAANSTVTVNEDESYTFGIGDFGYADLDGDDLSQIKITVLPADGTLRLDGTDVTLNQVIARADLVAGLLQFAPTANENGDGYASFEYEVNDGTGYSQAAYTMTVDVTPVDDPVVVQDDGPAQANQPVLVRQVIDGVPVTTTRGADGAEVTNLSVPATAANPAVVPVFSQAGATEEGVTARMTIPAGVSIVSSGFEAPQTAQASASSLGLMLQNLAGGGSGDTGIGGNASMSYRAEVFTNSLPTGTTVDVRMITPTATGGSPGTPIVITGSASASPVEALIIDASGLPAGSVLQLDDIEFAGIAGAVTVTGGAGNNVAVGDSATQWIELGEDDDILDGGAGDDIVGSRGGNDQIFGGEGNDIVYGGSGVNTLHGGSGLDTARYQGASDDYLIIWSRGATTVQSLTDPSTVDTLINVEQIEFSDQTLYIDHGAISPVVALYQNVLGREGDATGVQYWGAQAEAGLSLGDMAIQFLLSSEFTDGLQTGFAEQAVEDQVDSLYQGLLNRTADEAGKNYWMQVIESGGSVEDVAKSFVMSTEFISYQTDATAWSFSV